MKSRGEHGAIARRSLLIGGISALWVAAPLGEARAHPAHVTVAEAELVPARKVVEVALKVHAEDLETALRRAIDDRLRLDQRDVEVAIARYLRTTFVLRDPSGDTRALQLIGSELGLADAWVYFELTAAASLRGWTLEDRVLAELSREQANTVLYRAGERTTTLAFRRERWTLTLP